MNLRRTMLAALMLASFGCRMKNEALMAEIMAAVAPDSSCNLTVNNSTYAMGSYDPTVNGARGYSLSLLLRNNLQKAADDPVAAGEIANISRRARDVQVTSVEGCWYTADQLTGVDLQARGGELVDCKTLPGQSGVVPAVARIDEGEAQGLITMQVLDLAALRQIFGDAFSPMDIPPVGAFLYPDPSVNPQVGGGTQFDALKYGYTFALQSPANTATRSPAWGTKYPNRAQVTVMVQLRANLQLQTGEVLHTNWFAFPISVCPGCLQDYCGPLVQQVCARGPCSDGTPCLNTGQCSNSALLCSPVMLFTGARPDFYGSNGQASCLPAQHFATSSPLNCTPVGCDATAGG